MFDKLPYFSFKGDIELADSDIFLADGTPIFLSRTGYTGEQGFEIFVPYDKIVDIWNRILEAGKDEGVIPCGLAARDSVRAGAVLPLSQQDIGPWAFVNNPWPFTLPKDETATGPRISLAVPPLRKPLLPAMSRIPMPTAALTPAR